MALTIDHPASFYLDSHDEGIRTILPAPIEARPIDAKHFNREPAFFWPARDRDGKLLGYLCVYTFATNVDHVSLLVFQSNSFGRELWGFRHPPGLDLVVTQHGLKDHPNATLLFAGGSAQKPDSTLWHGDGQFIHIPADLTIGGPHRVFDKVRSLRSVFEGRSGYEH